MLSGSTISTPVDHFLLHRPLSWWWQLWPVNPPSGGSRGLASGLLGSGALLIVLLSDHKGWAFGIPWISAANHLTNRARDSSLPWVRSRSDVVVGLGRVLAKKLSSNSLARESKDEMDEGFRRLHHIRARPLSVVGKARHINVSKVS
ncbi:hypothetical protein BHE74_00029673 [Ensete ventricosum]|nr:hypothetical protein BHE74_00029673 [Ensete ventricosum]